jgi:hypothetical protein
VKRKIANIRIVGPRGLNHRVAPKKTYLLPSVCLISRRTLRDGSGLPDELVEPLFDDVRPDYSEFGCSEGHCESTKKASTMASGKPRLTSPVESNSLGNCFFRFDYLGVH